LHNLKDSANFAAVKKSFAIVLALIYLMVSSGVLVEIHHCMGRIADTGLRIMASSADDTCGQCGMNKSNAGKHCCKDEYKQVKISVDQKPSSQIFSPEAPLVAEVPVHWPQVNVQLADASTILSYQAHAPPIPLPDRQVLFCQFRI